MEGNESQNPRETFQSWVIFYRGRYWPDPEKMPEDVLEAYHDFCHYKGNYSPDHPKTVKASRVFEAITGYSAKDFYQFVRKLNKEQ